MNQEQLHQLAMGFISGVGAVNGKSLISYCGGVSEVFGTSKAKLLKIPGIGSSLANAIINSNAIKKAEEEAKFIDDNNIDFCFYLDKDYPSRLKQYADAPLFLFSKGKKMGDDLKTVAIVGTRSPSEYGKMMTDKIVAGLKPFNVNIISGLAYGIDTIAHQACVNNKINTIAVLGQGLKNIYPAQNRTLAKRIMDHGSLISEFPFNTQPDRENFPRRNRIIAGMSDAIIVVESAAKGGSIITANYGNDYFKDVFAIPGKIGDKKSEGCNKLIKQNKAHLLESVADIAYIMNWEKDDPKPKQMTLALDLDDAERRIVAFMKQEKVTNIDQMHYALELSLSNLSSSLLNLEFKGIVRSLPGKKYNLAI